MEMRKPTGRGVTAAVLDTGACPHRDFDSRILAFEDFVHGRSLPYDDNGHGTITGILLQLGERPTENYIVLRSWSDSSKGTG